VNFKWIVSKNGDRSFRILNAAKFETYIFFFNCYLRLTMLSAFKTIQLPNIADPSGCAVWGVGLQPSACWDRGFESHRGRGCLSLVQCLCCQVEVFATGRSLVQRSPTDCGVCLSVIKWNHKNPRHLLWTSRQEREGLRATSKHGMIGSN
jgi:hypothetical protein